MSRPEEGRSRTGWLAGAVVVVVTVAAVAALAIALVTVDVRRREEIRDLQAQLESLRHLVEAMGKQLEHHDRLINTTLQTKNTPKSEPAEEVVYEDEYEYDDEDGSYEYDDGDEHNTKATVKRTAVLSENGSSEVSTRHKRELRDREVLVHEERYVPSTPPLSRSKSEGLRMYATFYGDASMHKVSSEQSQHFKFSITEPMETQRRPVHQKTQVHSPVYQEQERAPDTIIRHRHSRGRNRHSSLENTRGLSQPLELMEQPQILAAHFVGDASRHTHQSHYFGNHLLFHPDGWFKGWSPSSWMTQEDKELYNFQDEKLAIQKSGLYLVYAQIYYAATHDRCGFHIKHNDEEVAQCMTVSLGRGLKRNTCFTSLVLQLWRRDLLWISEVEGHRNTSFKNTHSFFGLILLRPT